MTSVLDMNLWKFGNTSSADPFGVARALTDLIAATGSVAIAAVAAWPLAPATDKPLSTSQVASAHFSSRHSWAISRRASGCSCDCNQMPVKQAEIYSLSRCESNVQFLVQRGLLMATPTGTRCISFRLNDHEGVWVYSNTCLLYTSPSPRDRQKTR